MNHKVLKVKLDGWKNFVIFVSFVVQDFSEGMW